jgi:hypothetical protein
MEVGGAADAAVAAIAPEIDARMFACAISVLWVENGIEQ